MGKLINVALGCFGIVLGILLVRMQCFQDVLYKLGHHDAEIVNMIDDEVKHLPKISLGRK